MRNGENKRASAKVGVRNFLQRRISEMDKLKKLQYEYNKLHERLGYVYNENTIRVINKQLDEICEKMDKLLNSKQE